MRRNQREVKWCDLQFYEIVHQLYCSDEEYHQEV